MSNLLKQSIMKAEKGDLLTGHTGKIANTGMYRRVVNGMEIIQRCPKRKKKVQGPTGWSEQNRKFRKAAKVAKIFLANPEIREVYAKVAGGFTSPAAMFVKDYLKPAVISRVVTSGYRGRAGYKIVIRVGNVVPVKSVTVTIEGPGGELIESGQAVIQRSGFVWHYGTTAANLHYKNSRITIVSRDLPGHTVEWTKDF